MNREPRAEDFIYRLPSVEEVVAAGYPASYHEAVKRERETFIRRFNEDSLFRAEVFARRAKDKAERRAQRQEGGDR